MMGGMVASVGISGRGIRSERKLGTRINIDVT